MKHDSNRGPPRTATLRIPIVKKSIQHQPTLKGNKRQWNNIKAATISKTPAVFVVANKPGG